MSLRTIFFGTSEFSVPALRVLGANGDCALVVTQPDRPSGRGHRLRPTPVKAAALELGIPTIEPVRLRDVVSEIAAVGARLFVLASYGKIVPQAMLDLAPLGALNVHPSLLPSYRGATPLQSQLRDGVREGGVSLIFMDAGLDTGDIAMQRRSAIGEAESYGDLHDRFAALGAEMLREALDRLAAGTLARTPQADAGTDDDARRTMTAPLDRAELGIETFVRRRVARDGGVGARAIVDFVRSLAPGASGLATPVARSAAVAALVLPTTRDAPASPPQAKIRSAYVAAGPDLVAERIAPGGAVIVDGSIYLRATDGWVAVDTLVLPGHNMMDATQFRAKYGSLAAPTDLRDELLFWSRAKATSSQ